MQNSINNSKQLYFFLKEHVMHSKTTEFMINDEVVTNGNFYSLENRYQTI